MKEASEGTLQFELGDGFHSVAWPDQFRITRLCVVRNQLYVRLYWRGKETDVRLGARIAEIDWSSNG